MRSLIVFRYFDGQEDFHINVSDYKDIRMMEKVRKRAPRSVKGDTDKPSSASATYLKGNGSRSVSQSGRFSSVAANESEESSSDDEFYENMTSDFNTLIPVQKSRNVPSRKY